MVKLRYIRSQNIKASTVIEVVTGMVLITIVFVISSIIYLNVTKASLNVRDLKIRQIMLEESNNITESDDFGSEVIQYEEFVINKEVTSYMGMTGVYRATLTAMDQQNNVISEYQQLIYVP